METYQEKRKREDEAAKAKTDAATIVFWAKLRAALEAKGHVVETVEPTKVNKDDVKPSPTGRFHKVDDVRFAWNLTPERTHNTLNGKLRFNIGSSNLRAFFQSQARGGEFDYDAIVTEIEALQVRSREQKAKHLKEEAALTEGQDLRDRLVREFYPDLKDAEGIQTVPQGEPIVLQTTSEGGLKFAVSKPIKEEQLRELLATCKRVGVF